MKHVSILVPQGHFSLVNVEGSYQIFSFVNQIMKETGKQPLFRIQLVGISPDTTQTSGLFTIHPDVLLQDVSQTDLIIIPAIHGPMPQVLDQNKAIGPWLVRHYKEGAEIVSFCIGAFLLASTGLLNGRQCATHWHVANDFRKMFPQVHLLDDRILTEADGIYTSGGAFSFTNLLLYLVEKFAGREIAIRTAKTFMIDIDRSSQSPFMIFSGQKAHDDEAVLQAQAYIEQYYKERISVDTLADKLGVGRRTFERRFKKATANTIAEYIQRVKMEAAKKALESGRKNVAEAMYEVGYTDTKAFRDVFKKITGMSPVAYRNKYQKVAVEV